MHSIAETHFTPILFHSDQDLWNILPCNSPLASQLQNHCRTYIYTNQNFLNVLQTLTRAIFDSVSTGKLWRGCLGLVQDPSPACFPDILLNDNDFFMSRLHQNCPFIFRVINDMLNIFKPPLPFPSLAAPTTLAFFYRELKSKLYKDFPKPTQVHAGEIISNTTWQPAMVGTY